MSYNITGRIIEIGLVQTFDSGFTKRQFVIEEKPGADYPNPIPLEVVKDRCALLDSLQVGDTVTASYDLRGREYNGKYYVNVQAWRIERDEQQAAPQPTAQEARQEVDALREPDGDNLPF